MTERVRGHIRQLSHQRRCGFIQPGDGSPDIPVFLRDFCDTADTSNVTPGDAVEFRVQHAPEGPRAVDVTLLQTEAEVERVRGTVKWFNPEKRYGFIRRIDGLSDVFVHINDFRSRADAYWIREGATVKFGVVQAPKGPRAVDVVVHTQ